MIRYVFALSIFLMLSACRTAPPVKTSEFSEGHWQAKALIKDLAANKSFIVKLNLNAVKNQNLRMDVVSTLGTGVASMTADDENVRYILIPEKKFFYGAPSAEVMKPILLMPFDPRWLHNLLFEVAFQDQSWLCVKDGEGLLSSCINEEAGLKVTWSGRSGEKRTLFLEHAKASVQINISSFQPKVETRKNLFALEAPASYRKFRVK